MSSTTTTQLDLACDVVTPENIAFEYRMAGPLRRMPAFLIDLGLRLAFWILLAIVLVMFSTITFGEVGLYISSPVILLSRFGLEWFYGGMFEAYWNGQTPGKRLMGLRVLSTDGQPINGLQAMMRNILRFADMMPMVPFAAFAALWGWDPWEPNSPWAMMIAAVSPVPLFLVGMITPIINRRWQRLGDVVCGTMVVVEDRTQSYGVVRIQDPRAHRLAADLPHIDASRNLARALASYVERRQLFTPARRQEIAMHLGHPLIEKYSLPAVPDHDLLLCAMYLRVFVTDGETAEAAAVQFLPDSSPPVRQTTEDGLPLIKT